MQVTKVFWLVILRSYLCNILCKFFIKIESTRRREIKEKSPQLIWLYCGRAARSSHRRCSVKKAVLKNFAIFTGNSCVGVFSKKNCRSEGPNTGVFLWILRNFKNSYLFWKTSANGCFLTVSMAHCYMGLKVQGLDCMTASGFKVRVTGLVFFVSKSASLVVNGVPTCVQKPTTFNESIKFFRLVIFGHFR